MALADSRKEQAIMAIEECLVAAELCLHARKSNGGFLGYPAALLLLCAIDAKGHGRLPAIKGQHTRLDILAQPPFGLKLEDRQIRDLTKHFRHLLAHEGTMKGMLFPYAGTEEPFEFDEGGVLTAIRVPVLLEVVKKAWERLDKDQFDPPDHDDGGR